MEALTGSAFIALIISAIVTYFFQRKRDRKMHMIEQQLLDQQHENDKLLKKLDFEFQHRQKAKIVAELFAKWATDEKLTEERRIELNQLSYECSLWLPKEIMDDLHLRLTNAEGAKPLQKILTDVRQFLNPDIEALDWEKIVYWKKK